MTDDLSIDSACETLVPGPDRNAVGSRVLECSTLSERTENNGLADDAGSAAPSDAPRARHGAKGAQAASEANAAAILGQVAWLMMRSPTHRHLFLTDLEWLLMPPLLHTQFRLFQRNGMPFAFVSWAKLTQEAERRYVAGARRLQPSDWAAGDRLWLVDVVAPFGGIDTILAELHERVLADREIRLLRLDETGRGIRVEMLHGASGGTSDNQPGQQRPEGNAS